MDLTFWVELILFIVLLGFSGFFSSSETALFSLSQRQLEQMRVENDPHLGLIERLLSEPRRLIVTILIGNEFVNVAASVISAAMVIHLFGAENKLMNLFIMVPILLLVGEITPKTLAIRNNRTFASFQSRPIDLFATAITPLRWLVRNIADWFITLIVGKERSRGNIITQDLVRTLAHEAVGEGTLDRMEAQFIDQIFEFGNRTLEEIMTPRSDIHFLSVDMPLREMLKEMKATRHSRLPVYQEHRDTIVGILHARDLIGLDLAQLEREPGGLKNLLREPNFFPESKPAVELFDTFRERKLSFALTVDEYGGVTGLVTMEDLLECVFGDIRSPSDVHREELIQKLDDGRFSLDAGLPLADFNAEFERSLEMDQVETLGGVLLHEFGELPGEGAILEFSGFRFAVQEVEGNRITRILMEELREPVPVPEVVQSTDEEPAKEPPQASGENAEGKGAS